LSVSTFACGSSDDDGGGGGGGGGGGNGSTTTTLAPGPPTETLGTIGDCDARASDRYELRVTRGQLVTIDLDTVDRTTAADLCFKGRCGGVDVGGDDEKPCTAAPPAFACAHSEITTRRAGACTVDVLPCTDECASGDADYRLTIAAGGAGPAVALAADDVILPSGLCAGGTNDAETCETADECEGGGTCTPPPPAPVRAAGDLPAGTDIPPGARLACTVTVRMAAAVTYTNLKIKLDYSEADGGFRGLGRDVQCERITGGAGTFVDYDASNVLGLSLLAGAGIVGPRTLVRCPFVSSSNRLDPDDFILAVLDARDPAGERIEPGIELTVTCGNTTPTSSSTTSTSTTTTTTP
jgi:hypothetical protein